MRYTCLQLQSTPEGLGVLHLHCKLFTPTKKSSTTQQWCQTTQSSHNTKQKQANVDACYNCLFENAQERTRNEF